jgi:hypothetical protein
MPNSKGFLAALFEPSPLDRALGESIYGMGKIAKGLGTDALNANQSIQSSGGYGKALSDMFNPSPAESLGIQSQSIASNLDAQKQEAIQSRMAQQAKINSLRDSLRRNSGMQNQMAQNYLDASR